VDIAGADASTAPVSGTSRRPIAAIKSPITRGWNPDGEGGFAAVSVAAGWDGGKVSAAPASGMSRVGIPLMGSANAAETMSTTAALTRFGRMSTPSGSATS
jgi:hypothetical protein